MAAAGFEVNKYKISALLFWLLLLERGERGAKEDQRKGEEEDEKAVLTRDFCIVGSSIWT